MNLVNILGIVAFICFVTLIMWSFARVLQKAGFSRWLVLFLLFPIFNLVLIWLFAFKSWPNDPIRKEK